MPEFYAGPNGANAFSQGLQAGYEFVDRIQQRRLERQDRQRRVAREDELMNRQRSDWQYEDEQRGVAREDRSRVLQQEREQRYGVYAGNIVTARGGYDGLSDEDESQLINEYRRQFNDMDSADEDVAQQINRLVYQHSASAVAEDARDRDVAERADTLASIAGMQRPPQYTSSPGSEAPASPSPAVPASPGGGGLASVGTQVAGRTLPAGIQDASIYAKGSDFAPNPMQRKLPREVEVPNASPDGPVLSRPMNDEELATEVAKDPRGYATSWLDRRNKVKDPDLVARTDEAVMSALQEQFEVSKRAYEQTQRGTRDYAVASAAVHFYDKQLTALSKARGDQIVDDAMPRGSLGPGERRGAAAQAAVQAYSAAPPAAMSEAQERRLATVVNRAADRPGAQVSPTVLKEIALAEARGVIPQGSAMNFARYGQIEKPTPPQWQPLGNGYAVRIGADGRDVLVKLPKEMSAEDAAAAKNVWGADNERARNAMYDKMAGALGMKRDDPDVAKHLNALHVLLTGPNLPGLQILRQRGLVDAAGNFDPALMDDRDQAIVAEAYAKHYDKDLDSIWRSLRQNWSLTDRAVEAQTGELPEAPVLEQPAGGGYRIVQ